VVLAAAVEQDALATPNLLRVSERDLRRQNSSLIAPRGIV
jgi:hypothetical protein